MTDRIQRARILRQTATDAERRLWRRLREDLPQLKFRRQHPIGPLILEFYCHELRLAIEIDGSQHLLPEGALNDLTRTRYLEKRGIHVIRVTNTEVLLETDAVLQSVWLEINGSPFTPSP